VASGSSEELSDLDIDSVFSSDANYLKNQNN